MRAWRRLLDCPGMTGRKVMSPVHLQRSFSSQNSNSSSPSGFARDPENYADYCVNLVKKHDFDAYLHGLLIPTQARRAFFAIRAFNVETGLIKDTTSGTALPGQMRMQWWREVVGSIYKGTPPDHPVVRALSEVIDNHKLTRRWFDRILEARMKDLDNIQPANVEELEEYAENTASSLLYLTLESMGVRHPTADHAASHIGKATGIATLLRGTRHHARRDSIYIPLDIQRQFKVSPNDILQGPSSPEAAQALTNVFYEVATVAHLHMEHARKMLESNPGPPLPSQTITALLPAVRTSMYLEKLQKAGFNGLDEDILPRSHFTFQLRLFWAHLRGKI